MLKLYEMHHSPYCIPIAQMLRSAGVQYESIAVPNWDRTQIIELTDGAYYQVPVLAHDGQLVFEDTDTSLKVARYVDTQFCQSRLFPPDISGIHEVLIRHFEDELEGLSFKLCDIHYLPRMTNLANRVHSIRHKERKFGRGCLERWKSDEANLRSQFFALLAPFESTLTAQLFLFGAEPVYADFALSGVLGNYSFCPENQFGPEKYWLRSWMQRVECFKLIQGS